MNINQAANTETDESTSIRKTAAFAARNSSAEPLAKQNKLSVMIDNTGFSKSIMMEQDKHFQGQVRN